MTIWDMSLTKENGQDVLQRATHKLRDFTKDIRSHCSAYFRSGGILT